MINKNIVITLIVFIVIIMILISLIIGIFYFDLFNKNANNYIKINDSDASFFTESFDHTSDKNIINLNNTDNSNVINQYFPIKNNYKEINNNIKKDMNSNLYIANNISKNVKQKEIKNIPLKVISKQINSIAQKIIKQKKKTYSKGSALPDQNFDSYGEYISEEEYLYRLSLIKNLSIKTIVIDKLTQNKGISYEYFKVVYINKMIPSKILEDIVESIEFRLLIPKKYLAKETEIKKLDKGDKIIFKNDGIKNLLILWSLGRLSPFQKAWISKAYK